MDAIRQPCEMTVSRVLPALRSSLAKILMSNSGMNQTEVSDMLGITQAAVSYYTKEKRGDESLLKRHPSVEEALRGLADDMTNGLSPKERQERICTVCREMQNLMFEKPAKK
ncbi:MAG: winged helix-turn-helix transcriptional regulator [Methanobacteriota archaeon]|nr:MAG: winged helix-turn-helix transcriptional regulator [Euryarchaeota archaeon]